ncbi:MAG: hypothetical protein A2148_01270 [Chloroflexi bacterium RBG_16_68_14]|nr:MAG: hypothetical protein A2148_01270 [Chloroflexi bacterium RBG_16_68_14]
MRVILALPLTLAAGLFVAAACGDGEEAQPSPTATTAASATVAATATGHPPAATETPAPFQGGREPVEKQVTPSANVPLLADVRAASHEGFDRVVFEFREGLPSYRVEYIQQPIDCGSGFGSEVAGIAYVQVRMTPAAGHDETGTPTFGSQEISPSLPSLVQAVQTCDFEGDLTWVIGLNAEADFRVTELGDPPRLVIDIAHP